MRKRIRQEITQEYLRQIMDYNPKTGIFTWKTDRNWETKAGDKAGRLHHQGYIRIKIQSKDYSAARLAWIYMLGVDSLPKQVDHKDTNRANNIWTNLRAADNYTNTCNAKLRKDNTSKIKGVGKHKLTGKYYATIQVNNKGQWLGLFDHITDAQIMVEITRTMLHGEFTNHGITTK